MKKYDIPILCTYLLFIVIVETTLFIRKHNIDKIYNQIEVLLQNQDIKVLNVYETDITLNISRDVTPYYSNNSIIKKNDSALPTITRWRTVGTIDQNTLDVMRIEGDTLHITGYNTVVTIRLQLDPSIEIKYDNLSNINIISSKTITHGFQK